MGYISFYPGSLETNKEDWNVLPGISQDCRLSSLPGLGRLSDMVLLNEDVGVDEELTLLQLDVESNSFSFIPEDVRDYMEGLLQRKPFTEYVAFHVPDAAGFESAYYLFYDLDISEDVLVPGEYPYIMLQEAAEGFLQESGTAALTEVPALSYGSFGEAAELRNGGGIYETYALIFAVIVTTLFNVISGIFSFFNRQS